jgi:hypothetical protein
MTELALAYPPGIIRGATPAMAPGRWFDANLMRWRSGNMQPVGGWERMTQTPLASLPRKALSWVDDLDVQRYAFGCDSKLLILSGDTVFDATPVGFAASDGNLGTGGYGIGAYGLEDYGTPRSQGSIALLRAPAFSLGTFGQSLLALASWDGKLYRYNPATPAAVAAVIANAPVSNTAMIVTPERHVVLLGCGGAPRRVAWCSRENYDDWNFASTTNTAGFLDMDTAGRPVAAVRVREGTLIFTDVDVWLLRFVGSPSVYSLERIGETTTLLSPNAIATFSGRAVWMGREGFFLYDGGYVKPLPCDVGDFVYDQMDPLYRLLRSHASANGSFPEIWFHYPKRDSVECDRLVIWNYEEGWWGLGDIGRSCMIPAGINRFPVATGTDKNVFQHESGWTDAGVSLVTQGRLYAEGGTVRLGDGERAMTVNRSFPDTSGVPCKFKFLVRDAPGGAERVKGPYTPRADGKMDVRFTGRDVRLRVEPAADGDFSVGQLLLKPQTRGGR